MTFDYKEARKAGKTEAPAEFAEKCRNGFHHRDTETMDERRWTIQRGVGGPKPFIASR